MTTIFVVCIVIVLVVLFLAVITTSKAYGFKHTVDPVDQHPNLEEDHSDSEKNP